MEFFDVHLHYNKNAKLVFLDRDRDQLLDRRGTTSRKYKDESNDDQMVDANDMGLKDIKKYSSETKSKSKGDDDHQRGETQLRPLTVHDNQNKEEDIRGEKTLLEIRDENVNKRVDTTRKIVTTPRSNRPKKTVRGEVKKEPRKFSRGEDGKTSYERRLNQRPDRIKLGIISGVGNTNNKHEKSRKRLEVPKSPPTEEKTSEYEDLHVREQVDVKNNHLKRSVGERNSVTREQNTERIVQRTPVEGWQVKESVKVSVPTGLNENQLFDMVNNEEINSKVDVGEDYPETEEDKEERQVDLLSEVRPYTSGAIGGISTTFRESEFQQETVDAKRNDGRSGTLSAKGRKINFVERNRSRLRAAVERQQRKTMKNTVNKAVWTVHGLRLLERAEDKPAVVKTAWELEMDEMMKKIKEINDTLDERLVCMENPEYAAKRENTKDKTREISLIKPSGKVNFVEMNRIKLMAAAKKKQLQAKKKQ